MGTNKEYNSNVQNLAVTALMMAMVLLGTMVIKVPTPMTQGYVHLGDAMIYLSVSILGRRNSALAAGLGSAMADVLGGYAMWAPWTLIIKGSMAFLTASLMQSENGRNASVRLRAITAMVAGGFVMVAGYFAAEFVMYGNIEAAFFGIPWNIGQFVIGIVISTLISAALKRNMNR